MVTAVVIPIIIIYFLWRTRKEMRVQESKWLQIGNVQKESVLNGEITNVRTEKQRFYYNRYIYIQEIQLETDTKLITIKKRTPLTKEARLDPFKAGEFIRVYGSWQEKDFYFQDYEVLTPVNNSKR